MPRSRTIVLPLLLAAAMVGSVAPMSLAQDEVTTAAGLNADRVDGKDAVSATSKKRARANKLVATDSKGYLPSNILKPLWSLVQGIPAVLADGQVAWAELVGIPGDLADGQVGWGEVGNKPAGFADGTDDAGVTGVKVTRVVGPFIHVPVKTDMFAKVDCPSGSLVTGGGHSVLFPDFDTEVAYSFPDDADTWVVGVSNLSATHTFSFAVIAVCMSVEPGGALTVAKKKGVKIAKVTKRHGRRG
jgi:hypothetical protein